MHRSHLIAAGLAGLSGACAEDGDASAPRPGIAGEPTLSASEPSPPAPSAPEPGLTWSMVDAGGVQSCGIVSDGRLVCWGDPACDPAYEDLPAGPFSSVSVGNQGGCVLDARGDLGCWCCGWGDTRICERADALPVGPFTRVERRDGWGCAQDAQGELTCFGGGDFEQVGPVPSGPVLDYAMDINYACAVRSDGTLSCWGMFLLWQEHGARPPADVKFSRISVGREHACGLDVDGRLHCWGADWVGDPFPDPPVGTFASVVTEHQITCALDDRGAASCWWGWSFLDGQWIVPDAEWRAIGLGEWDACGATIEGGALCWGGDSAGEVDGLPSLDDLR